MDTTSLLIVIVAAVYGMLSLMSLVLLARRVSMLDYCLRELEKKLPILIPSDLSAKAAPVESAVVVSAGSGLTSPIGSIELKKPELGTPDSPFAGTVIALKPVAQDKKSKKSSKTKPTTKKGKK